MAETKSVKPKLPRMPSLNDDLVVTLGLDDDDSIVAVINGVRVAQAVEDDAGGVAWKQLSPDWIIDMSDGTFAVTYIGPIIN
jgi:hypothetical protein